MSLTLFSVLDGPPSLAVQQTLKALDVEYTLINVEYEKGDHLTEEFAQRNPQREIPIIDDNGFQLGESNAIIQYLADKYGKDDKLYPKEVNARAIVNQRLCFNLSTYYKHIYDHAMAPIYFDYERTPLTLKKANIALDVFNTYLQKNGTIYAVTDHVTIADFQLISSTMCLEAIDFDLSPYPLISKWYNQYKKENPDLWALVEPGMNKIAAFNKNLPDFSHLTHPFHPIRQFN